MHKNWHQKSQDELNTGERIADSVARGVGSWTFIIWANVFVLIWVILNLIAYFAHWDVYPFILLNLVFSWAAFNSTPIIMMAQNRAAARDKIQAEHQYEHQEKELALNTELTKELHDLTKEIHSVIVPSKEETVV